MDDLMTQDLDTFLGMSIASDAFRVERTYGNDGAELTQLVHLVLADGSELGPYIRKQFETASGVGSVYNIIWHAQREGMRSSSLPRVICCKESNGVESVLLEYIAGETLSDYVARTGPSLECACEIFPRLCSAADVLRTSFDPPLIHRDIKPSNSLISCGAPVLIDFGIARQYRPDATQDTTKFGTRGYAAPEQYGFGQTGVQTDVYALGMVLYFCLTGENPQGALTDKDIGACDIPRTCKDVLRRATAFDPSDRYPTARDLELAWSRAVDAEKESRHVNNENPEPAVCARNRSSRVRKRGRKRLTTTYVLILFWLLMLLGAVGTALDPVPSEVGVPLWFRLLEYPVMMMCSLAGIMYPFLDKGFVFKMIPPLGRMSKPERFVCISAIAILPVFIVSIIGMMAGII